MATKQLVSSFARLVLPLCVLVLLLGAPSHRAEAQCQDSPCVDSAYIVNGSVARADLVLNAVGATQITAGAVGISEIAVGARPNILVLMADEHFANAMSSVIGTQHLNTPNLDSLAASGMRFKRSYAANPICVPSRSSMFTGRFPHQIGIQSNQATNLDAVKYPLMGKYFSDAGYDTGYIGK